MSVTHGGDPGRLREIARQLGGSADGLSGCQQQAQDSRLVLEGSWNGPDAEHLLMAVQRSQIQLTSAADRLVDFARRLTQQADQQEQGSAGGDGAPSGPPRSAPPGNVVADNNDARDNRWWWDRKETEDYETDGDPGSDIEMPEGLDSDSQLARDLMATPEGRETLEWLRLNDIEIKYDDSKTGAFYQPWDNSITFGVDDPSLPEGERQYNDSPGTLIHEANHAQWDARDQVVETGDTTRQEYIDGKLDEEIEGQSDKWAWNEQARSEGIEVPMGGDEQAYHEAVDQALADGATPAEAETAGREEVRQMFEGTHPTVSYEQSTDGQNYADRHGDDWDSAHDWWPLW